MVYSRLTFVTIVFILSSCASSNTYRSLKDTNKVSGTTLVLEPVNCSIPPESAPTYTRSDTAKILRAEVSSNLVQKTGGVRPLENDGSQFCEFLSQTGSDSFENPAQIRALSSARNADFIYLIGVKSEWKCISNSVDIGTSMVSTGTSECWEKETLISGVLIDTNGDLHWRYQKYLTQPTTNHLPPETTETAIEILSEIEFGPTVGR